MTKLGGNIGIKNTNYTLKDLVPVVLYSSNGETGNITFDGNYQDYSYLIVTDEIGTAILPSFRSELFITAVLYSDTLYQSYDDLVFSYNSNTNKTTITHVRQGSYYSNSNHSSNYKVFKIVGLK